MEHGFVCQGGAHSYAHSNRDNYDKQNIKTIKFDARLKQTDNRQIGKKPLGLDKALKTGGVELPSSRLISLY